MELNEILNFIKKYFPYKYVDISESLELLRDTIDDIINDVSCKTRQAYNERNFNVIEGFIELNS